jgi:pilus assembly protein FimV
MGAAPKTTEAAAEETVVDDTSPPIEFRIDDLTPGAPITPAMEPESGDGLDFDLEDEALAMAESDTTALLDSEIDTADEEGGALDEYDDEVTTKLDLARAYLDMGDEEGATSILTEVLEEGNADQRQEAHDLMADLHK